MKCLLDRQAGRTGKEENVHTENDKETEKESQSSAQQLVQRESSRRAFFRSSSSKVARKVRLSISSSIPEGTLIQIVYG